MALLGYVIVERNYSCKLGEIDIIAKDGEVLVFVEVKYRRSERFGLPEQAVGREKQARLRRSAQWYMAVEGISEMCSVRFDVVAMDSREIRLYRDAF